MLKIKIPTIQTKHIFVLSLLRNSRKTLKQLRLINDEINGPLMKYLERRNLVEYTNIKLDEHHNAKLYNITLQGLDELEHVKEFYDAIFR